MLASLARRRLERPCIVGSDTAALAFAGHGTELTGGLAAGMVAVDDRRGLVAVVDARFDNRGELCSALDCRRDATDAELVMSGYERWGTSFADAICGDFAFVVWDVRRRTLYAARDPFGVKGIYYSVTGERVLLSNDVEPLVAFTDRTAIDRQMALDYLTTSFGHFRKTFFEGIARLQPGHFLWATESACRQVRYFFPPSETTSLGTTADYEQEFRRLLTLSIRARLRSAHPVVAHLSGGLDSTSIVLLADEIYKGGAADLPPLHTASAVFPGLDCDESDTIAATSARVAFPGETWIGYHAEWQHIDNPTVAWPGSPAPISGGSAGDLAIAKRLGARVILTGGGGDEVSYGGGVFRDIAAAGEWRTLLRETLGASRLAPRHRWMFLRDAAVALVPDLLRDLRQWVTPARSGAPPPWLGDDLRGIWPGDADNWNDLNVGWASSVQERTWRALVWVTSGISMDYRLHYGAEGGVEFRFPFLDRRLVKFVLSIPWKHRLPGGFMRRLQWKALEELLPAQVLARRQTVTAESARIREGQAGIERYLAILEDGEWVSEPFVVREAALRLLERARGIEALGADLKTQSKIWQTLQRAMSFEAWLRAVFSYIAPLEE